MAASTKPSATSAPSARARRAPFVPGVRGDLGQATASPQAFAAVAPSVPRPVAYLLDRRLCAIPRLGARDVALWEWIVSYAIAVHPDGLPAQVHEPAIPVRPALVAMSGRGRPVQPRELSDSLVRLFGGERQDLAIGDAFRCSLPEWVPPLLRQGLYGYLDLAVLAGLATKSGALLYRHLVGRLAAERVRFMPDARPHVVTIPVAELGEILGMPAPIRMGPLRIRYLKPALADLANHVTAFKVEAEEAKDERGHNVAVAFSVRLRPPEMRTAAARLLDRGDLSFLQAHPDEPSFQLKVATLVKLGSAIPSRRVTQPKAGSRRRPEAALASEMHAWRRLWLAALDEALTGTALTPSYETGTYRGQRLLDAIARDGADRAFWAFVMAEVETPDLQVRLDASASHEPIRILAAAERARILRFRAARAERRRALRHARAEGTLPPATPKNTMTDSRPMTAPTPVVPPVAPAPAPAAPTPDAALVALLATDEAKAEARKLWWYWQPASEFPRLHAAAKAKLLLDEDLDRQFPIFARADEAMGGEYRKNLRWLAEKFDMPRQPHEDPVATKVPPFVDADLAEGMVTFLGLTLTVPVQNGLAADPKAALLRDRDFIMRRVQKIRSEWEERAARIGDRFQRGVPRTFEQKQREMYGTPLFVATVKDRDGIYRAAPEPKDD
ncbi:MULTISPECIES: hypothetical protein [Methylobacteriaceae]|uniref:Initiator Rep protein domain-containing protein n=2 Tax=Methylobacteriaceae TaxID=119045 RepID=A0AA37HT92_9HYPH|nr:MULTISPECIES: hypothetical protein [Methylobacteriaceae]MDQ0520077.1 hypothetical protein [Methylobacterium gregans]BAU90637.1 hypothetical protein MPPM_2032 [Methylorubrum populi]GJD81230.1 hypothetical protein NBEOAGPD_4476 [Methylobacterium gregans]GLS52478.1 hypothetical protein GCM10007886_06610 [Methylobacterium gregans]